MEKSLINRKIGGSFEVIKTYSAGIKLLGEEVKALREGKGSLRGSYIKNIGGQMYIVGFKIPKYSRTSNKDYQPDRSRKLLLNRKEIVEISSELTNKGRTAIPLEVFFDTRQKVKVKIAVAKGLSKAGNRQYEKERQIKKDMDKEVKEIRYKI